jgi:nitroreductase
MREDVYTHILQLRAIRSFSDEPLAADDLDAILEAGRWTGSAKNLQNWSFVVVDDPDQKRAVAGCGNFTSPVDAAPLVIALVQERGGYEFDTGRLAQNMLLAAAARGVASCPVTLHHEEEAAAVLRLPEGCRCRYAIALGYQGDAAGPRPWGGRKPIEELVHANVYGSSRNPA